MFHRICIHSRSATDALTTMASRAGSAEENFGRMMKQSSPHIATKCSLRRCRKDEMWPAPTGGYAAPAKSHGSIDQSLKRMNLDYVDLYSHRYDGITPSMKPCKPSSISSGKASFYIGLSKYPVDKLLRLPGTTGTIKRRSAVWPIKIATTCLGPSHRRKNTCKFV